MEHILYAAKNLSLEFQACFLNRFFFDLISQNKPIRFKGSSDLSHFIFEINVGKGRLRHITTLNLNDAISIDFESI